MDYKLCDEMIKFNFYDENGEKNINYTVDKSINGGNCGRIFKLDENTLLKYFIRGEYDEAAFKTIMNMNLDNFYKIYKLLYNSEGKFVGYTMKSYKDENIDILTMPTDYTLDNLIKLSNSVKRLSDNNILINDMREGNSVMDSNNITIIDIDLYKKVNNIDIYDLSNLNKKYLFHLFAGLYFKSLCTYHDAFKSDNLVIDSLFNGENDTSDICKRLVKYKYPIDYIYECRKKY